jgi:hypothetical protein
MKYNISSNATANWAIVPSVTSDGNITLGNVTITGNLVVNSPGVIFGNGSGLHSLNGANVVGAVANATFANISGVAYSVAGANVVGAVANATSAVTVTANAQPNITSIGTLTSLAVSGTSNLGAVGNVTITGGTSGQFLQTNGSGSLTWATVGTSGIANGTTNVSIPTTNGNVIVNVDGQTILTVSDTGANIVGGLTTTTSIQTPDLTTGSSVTAGTITGNWTLTTGSRLNATYADLAERHHADQEYPVGTVMKVGGPNEVTGASVGDRVLGVVSHEYAYLMNSAAGDDATHPAVAYVGRVPVRITGPINKHDVIVATLNGCARAGYATEGFGWALETNTDDAEKLVLCIIK